MKKICIILLGILIWGQDAWAHRDRVYSYGRGDLTFRVQAGFRENESLEQGRILSEICQDYLLTYGGVLPYEHVFIHFYECYYQLKSEYHIGIDSVHQKDHLFYLKRKEDKILYENEKEALIIHIETRRISAGQVLRLLHYGMTHKESILQNQGKAEALDYYKTQSISQETISSILQTDYKEIQPFLDKAYWRKMDDSYFYQNNRYHFPREKDTLSLNHVFQIIDNKRIEPYGKIIFNSDSSFYYLPENDTLPRQGSYILDSILIGRSPIYIGSRSSSLQYFSDYPSDDDLNIGRIEMRIEGKGRTFNRILFFPKLQRIVQHYDILEREHIRSVLQPSGKIGLNHAALIALLLLSVGMNVFLWLKRS